MSDKTASWDKDPSDSSVSARIDMACDDFEQAWKQGRAPVIESYLLHFSESDRPGLFRELLQIELSLLVKEEEKSPLLATYLKRFPEMRADIEPLFTKIVPPKRLGDYDLLEELGKGGMGVVYRARHRRLDKIVALKVLPESCLDEDGLARFEREMRSTARLDHPNIVQATDARVDNGVHYLVMEYIDGITFHQVVSLREEPVPYPAACEAIRQAALGLEHAWRRKLVHRDIKPSNLMLNSRGEVKILDFGLARVRAEEATHMLTQSGFAMGTVDYMAPEQWEDSSSVDIRADIYSLACTFFYMLAKKPPYGGEEYSTSRQKFIAHMTAEIPSLSTVRTDCPKEIDNLLRSMLAKEASDRLPTPTDIIECVGPHCDRAALKRLLETKGQQNDVSGSITRTGQWQQTTYPGTERSGISDLRRADSASRSEGPPLNSRRMFMATALGTGGAIALGLGAWFLQKKDWQESLQAHLATLPVLQGLPDFVGAWWFEELPWLTPAVRKHIVTALEGGEKQIGKIKLSSLEEIMISTDVNLVMEQVKQLAIEVHSELADETEQNCAIKLQSLVHPRDDLNGYVEGLQSVLQDLGSPTSATQHHLRAVISHQLARKAPELEGHAAAALQSYDAALQFYAQENEAWLFPLCLADSGYCYYHGIVPAVEGSGGASLRDAETTFSRALTKSDAPAFQVSIGCQIAEVLKKKRAYDQALHHLDTADTIKSIPPEHPLKALVHDRRGYVLRDAWFFRDAAASFTSAITIRSGVKEGSAYICKLVSRQGLATVSHSQGRIDDAREAFDRLTNEVEQSTIGEIRDRGPNLYERRAICELIGACQNRKTQAAAAVTYFALGIDMAESRFFEKDHRRKQVLVLRAWHWIARLLAGGENTLSDKKEEIEERAREQGLSSSEKAAFAPHLLLAEALAVAQSPATPEEEQAAPLLEYLETTRSNKNILRPRDFELPLLAIEQSLLMKLSSEQLLFVTRELHHAMDKGGKRIDDRPPEGRGFFYPYANLALDALNAAAEEAATDATPLSTGLTRQRKYFQHWLHQD